MPTTDDGLRTKLRRIANETAELPGIRVLAKPLYRRMFERNRYGNVYYGSYQSHAQARAAAPSSLPSTQDTAAAARYYRDRLDRIRVSDYPMVHWLSRLLAAGQRRVFDLGGHIGVSYYGFRNYLDYPADLHWLVHDMPMVIAAGREWAVENDPQGALEFAVSPNDADGCDVLLASGTLQYLDYTLPELLRGLDDPPANVLINLTPMHPSRGYFTLQNMGFAICPYRVMAVQDFIAEMEDLGYSVVDHWKSGERSLRVPFEPDCAIDGYHGFYCRRTRAVASLA